MFSQSLEAVVPLSSLRTLVSGSGFDRRLEFVRCLAVCNRGPLPRTLSGACQVSGCELGPGSSTAGEVTQPAHLDLCGRPQPELGGRRTVEHLAYLARCGLARSLNNATPGVTLLSGLQTLTFCNRLNKGKEGTRSSLQMKAVDLGRRSACRH
jgi:hypothetical protein